MGSTQKDLASIFDFSGSTGLRCIALTPIRTLFGDGVTFRLPETPWLAETQYGLSGGVSSPTALDMAELGFDCSESQVTDSSVLCERLLLRLGGFFAGRMAL